MSVGQDLVGKVFQVGQYSTGTVADFSADPLAYTETDDAPGSLYGAGIVTITGVATDAQGVTTITASVATSFGPQTAKGTLIGNDADDILVDGSIAGQSATFFLTNNPPSSNGTPAPAVSQAAFAANASTPTGSQPGLGNTAFVATESDNIPYDPNATTVCFASGTLLRTPQGDVAVEDLAAGDLLSTSAGAVRPIRWLGQRTIDCRAHPRSGEVMPVRIAAHAFSHNRPARDLHVSPAHAICVDLLGEVLIPAVALVNGTTITQVEVDKVTYWHVELDSHEILLAENLPAESYLEMGNRSFFRDNGIVDFVALPDAAARTHTDFCRPYVDKGPLLRAARARLDVQAERREAALARAVA